MKTWFFSFFLFLILLRKQIWGGQYPPHPCFACTHKNELPPPQSEVVNPLCYPTDCALLPSCLVQTHSGLDKHLNNTCWMLWKNCTWLFHDLSFAKTRQFIKKKRRKSYSVYFVIVKSIQTIGSSWIPSSVSTDTDLGEKKQYPVDEDVHNWQFLASV